MNGFSACVSDHKTGNTAQTDTLSIDSADVFEPIETEESETDSKGETGGKKAISVSVKQEYEKKWTEDVKPQPLFTDKQIEERLNALSKLKGSEKTEKGFELQKDFNNPMEGQAVIGKFADSKKTSYTINEYAKRLGLNEDLSVKVVKSVRNEQNRIVQLEVEETENEE